MTVAMETLENARPDPKALLGDQVQMVFRRQWPALVLFLVLTGVYSAVPAFTSSAEMASDLFSAGRFGSPGSSLVALVSLFWAMVVWSDFPPGSRLFYRMQPLGAAGRFGFRIASGALLLLGSILAGLVMGSLTVFVLHAAGPSYFINGWTPAGLGLLLLGGLNAYLVGTLFALWLRRPEVWALIGVPVVMSSLMWIFAVIGLTGVSQAIARVFKFVVEGMGVWLASTSSGLRGTGPVWPVIICMLFLVPATWYSMVRHRAE